MVMLPLFTHFVAFEYYLSLFVYNVGVNTNAWWMVSNSSKPDFLTFFWKFSGHAPTPNRQLPWHDGAGMYCLSVRCMAGNFQPDFLCSAFWFRTHIWPSRYRKGLGAATLGTGFGSRVVMVGGEDAQRNLYNDVWESLNGGLSWSLGAMMIVVLIHPLP